MAKVCFYLPDGGEKTFRVFPDRALRVGRDPGNDAVLRDAKVSRRHAEITFERGFYVIHDLGSANGTYVNGRRVRIAPLTDGSELRLGQTLGRFVEEAAQQPPERQQPPREIYQDETPSGTVAMPSPPVDLPSRPRPPAPRQEPPRPTYDQDDDEVFETRPHRRGDPLAPPEDDKRDEYEPRTVLGPRRTHDEPSRDSERPTVEEDPFKDSEFSIESHDAECSVVSDSRSVPMFYFRRPGLFATFLAGMIAVAMVAAGATTAAMFFMQGHDLPALVAVGLTIVFSCIAVTLVPPRNIELFRDEAMTDLAMTIWQESSSPFPHLRYCARTDDGVTIAYFRKSFFGNAGRRRWWILDEHGETIGCAVEDSLVRALVRKLAGGFSSALTTDFLIQTSGKIVGTITRRALRFYRSVLSLYDSSPYGFDARVAVALAVLIESIERR